MLGSACSASLAQQTYARKASAHNRKHWVIITQAAQKEGYTQSDPPDEGKSQQVMISCALRRDMVEYHHRHQKYESCTKQGTPPVAPDEKSISVCITVYIVYKRYKHDNCGSMSHEPLWPLHEEKEGNQDHSHALLEPLGQRRLTRCPKHTIPCKSCTHAEPVAAMTIKVHHNQSQFTDLL